jgi:hypothetical protein
MPQPLAALDSRLSHERRPAPRTRPTTPKRLIHLAAENARLQRTVAELRLRNILLEEVLTRRG